MFDVFPSIGFPIAILTVIYFLMPVSFFGEKSACLKVMLVSTCLYWAVFVAVFLRMGTPQGFGGVFTLGAILWLSATYWVYKYKEEEKMTWKRPIVLRHVIFFLGGFIVISLVLCVILTFLVQLSNM